MLIAFGIFPLVTILPALRDVKCSFKNVSKQGIFP